MVVRTTHALALALAATLLGCGSEGATCRSSDDCAAALECAGPSEPQVCGIPPHYQCAADQDCVGTVCHAVFDACSPNGFGSECRLACTEQSCGEGMRCGAGGACEAIPCDEGWTCPDHQACDPAVAHAGPVYARGHGCVAVSCSNDDVCPNQSVCVNGSCQAGEGTCVEPMIVP